MTHFAIVLQDKVENIAIQLDHCFEERFTDSRVTIPAGTLDAGKEYLIKLTVYVEGRESDFALQKVSCKSVCMCMRACVRTCYCTCSRLWDSKKTAIREYAPPPNVTLTPSKPDGIVSGFSALNSTRPSAYGVGAVRVVPAKEQLRHQLPVEVYGILL